MGEKPQMATLFSAEQIQKRIREIGATITRDYQGQEVVLVGVLKGSFIFLADLARAIDLPIRIEFIGVASYVGTKSTGHVRITTDLTADIINRHVLLIEDIVDSGTTIDYLINTLKVRNPKSLKVCTFLSKPTAHQMKTRLDYVGFEISREFVVGYGLDLDGAYRGLPEIKQVVS